MKDREVLRSVTKSERIKASLGLERPLAQRAARMTPAERLSLAAVYERWARQLRFSVEIQSAIRASENERMEGVSDWALASLVSARIEEQLTPKTDVRDPLEPTLYIN